MLRRTALDKECSDVCLRLSRKVLIGKIDLDFDIKYEYDVAYFQVYKEATPRFCTLCLLCRS